MENTRVYREEIQTRLNYVKENYKLKHTETLKLCRFLMHTAKEENDSYLIAFAIYYMGESYFFASNNEKAASLLMSGIKYLQAAGDYSKLAKCHNMLGIIQINNGNTSSALEHFFTSLSYCRQYGYSYTEGIVNTNIASIYVGIQDYRNAVRYFRSSLHYMEADQSADNYKLNYTAILCTLGSCYCNLGKLKQAASCYRKIERLHIAAQDRDLSPTIAMFYSRYFDLCKDKANRTLSIERSIRSIPECTIIIYYIDDFFEHCAFLLRIQEYGSLLELLDALLKTPEIQDVTNFKFTILDLRMQYFKQTGQLKELMAYLPSYYNLSERLNKESEHASLAGIKMRLSYENTMRKQKRLAAVNAKLRLRSESDGMTGLPNRTKLNDQAQLWLEAAIENHKSIAIGLLDIDHFKQYNDFYGHLAGDDCLRAISSLLREITADTVFCARYGGDEFVLLYFDKTKEEIAVLAETLQKNIAALQIEHLRSEAAPYVTITQGISISKPTEGNKIWDLMHMADLALYRLKGSGRRNQFGFWD